jgi:hypothetical protein
MEQVDLQAVVLGVIAGLPLFLFGVDLLARAMRTLAGDRLRAWLARATTNRLAGLATGTATTAVLNSSSLTVVLVITLVDAGLLTAVRGSASCSARTSALPCQASSSRSMWSAGRLCCSSWGCSYD